MFKPQRQLTGAYYLAGFSALGFLAAFSARFCVSASGLAAFGALASVAFFSSPLAALAASFWAKSSALEGPFGASSLTGRVSFTEPPAFSTAATADFEAPA